MGKFHLAGGDPYLPTSTASAGGNWIVKGVSWFEKTCRSCGVKFRVPKNAVGKLNKPVSEFDFCRTCYKDVKLAKQSSWKHETIITRRQGAVIKRTLVNSGKRFPKELANPEPVKPVTSTRKYSEKKAETKRHYRCYVGSTRHEPARVVTTKEAMTLEEAKKYFRFALSRENLSGCSVEPMD
jgi:hypothetical protein